MQNMGIREIGRTSEVLLAWTQSTPDLLVEQYPLKETIVAGFVSNTGTFQRTIEKLFIASCISI